MVKIGLQIKATLENIEELKPNGSDFRWYFKFSCNNCGEVSEKWNYASLDESTPAQRGNAINHFISKCKLCSRENSMTIIEDSIKSYNSDDQGKFKIIVCLECRGIEPCDYSPREGWIAKACNNGNVFTDIDLSDGEWVEYCDKINSSVGIYEIESRFERIK